MSSCDPVPLVMLPGMLCTERLWQPVADLLPRDVSVLHRRLVGRSIDSMVRHLLDSTPERFDVAGLSLGGIVAMALCHAAPHRVRRLAVFSTNARPPTDEQRRAWRGLQRQVTNGEFRQGAMTALLPPAQLAAGGPTPMVAADIAAMISRTGPDGFLEQLAAQATRTDLRMLLPEIPHPALVVAAGQDHLCSREMHEEIARLIPQSRLSDIPQSGHLSSLEQPAAVAGLLSDFLHPSAPTVRTSSMPDHSMPPLTTLGVTSHGYRDVCDYIEKITNAIWNGPERDPELVSSYYGSSAPIQTDNGDVLGAAQVTSNTYARLRAFPDFHGAIEDTIWTGSESVGYRTSMRWTWTGTNSGSTMFGEATGKPVRYSAIANCVVQGDQIVDEWLGSNTLSLARQLAFTEQEAVSSWEASDPAPVSGRRPTWDVAPDGPGLVVAELLDRAFNGRDLSVVERRYAEQATQQRGTDRSSPSRAAIRGWFQQWLDLSPALSWSVDDSYWLPAEGEGPARVATQWTLRGETDAGPFRIAAISHHHVRAGRVVAEWTEYDQLALLRQCHQTI